MKFFQPKKNQTEKYSALVSHGQKAVWYKVRKCASISINNSLPGDDWVPVNNNRNPRQFEAEYFGDYFRFAFVRNPFGRLVSNYLHKIKDKSVDQIRSSYILHLDFHEGMSFEEFALQICALPEEKCDRHYRSMYTSIDLNNIDFIGRLENMQSDFRHVCTRISNSDTGEVSRMNTQGSYNYRDFYSASLEQRVGDRYQKDLQLFGYEFDRFTDSGNAHESLSQL
ncbi:MAG: sulfotransferase family protein [Gammaproteobacteria bacterium]|nr:sulfotransferase family protein [Gammaproteobacteria bacterium]